MAKVLQKLPAAVEAALNMAQKGSDRVDPEFDLDAIERLHGLFLSPSQITAARGYWAALVEEARIIPPPDR